MTPYVLFLGVITSSFLHMLVFSNPCDPGTYKILHSSENRAVGCTPSGNGICDRNLGDGWFVAQNYDDEKPRIMYTQSIGMFKCGTQRPIWMNGSHPNVEDGVVNRTTCASGTDSDCDDSYVIKVLNCSGYYVYNLEETRGCEGYCFEGDSCSDPDPCKSNHVLSDGETRGISCKSTDTKLCDDQLEEVWYRVKEGVNDLDMPQSPVELFRCGTTYPIWLDGDLPTSDDIVVYRNACVTGINNPCDKLYSLAIRNCTYFNVYKLPRTTECAERFCFGNHSTCDFGTIGQEITGGSGKIECDIGCITAVSVIAGTFFLLVPVATYKLIKWKKWKSVGSITKETADSKII